MKTVLITGTSAGGIGSALAQAFQKRGLHVFATARDASKIDHGLAELPNVSLLTLDVTSSSSISAAVAAVRAHTSAGDGRHGGHHGSLDYLVNNAGAGQVAPFLDVELEEARRVFEVNFWGVLAVTQAFAPLLVEARGAVVNVGSVAAEAWNPYESEYLQCVQGCCDHVR